MKPSWLLGWFELNWNHDLFWHIHVYTLYFGLCTIQIVRIFWEWHEGTLLTRVHCNSTSAYRSGDIYNKNTVWWNWPNSVQNIWKVNLKTVPDNLSIRICSTGLIEMREGSHPSHMYTRNEKKTVRNSIIYQFILQYSYRKCVPHFSFNRN